MSKTKRLVICSDGIIFTIEHTDKEIWYEVAAANCHGYSYPVASVVFEELEEIYLQMKAGEIDYRSKEDVE